MTALTHGVGDTVPASERYTQPPNDFGGLLAQYSTATSLRQFYLSDLSENIGVLAYGNTPTESHLFQPFGPVLLTSTPPTTQPYGFGGNVGYYTDPISGMQVAWNRVYDPNSGQWFNPDPIGFEGGDWNLRRFVGNNPMRWVDARGTQSAVPTWPISWPGPVPITWPRPITWPGFPLPGGGGAGGGVGVGVGEGGGVGVGVGEGGGVGVGLGEAGGAIIAACLADPLCWGLILGLSLAAAIAFAISYFARKRHDVVLVPYNPGRGCNGTCNPCTGGGIPQIHDGKLHNGVMGHWHCLAFEQAPSTCMCYVLRCDKGAIPNPPPTTCTCP